MSNQPLLSIIIPTKDRYCTLIPIVDSFLNHIVGDDYEIVIQDNSGDNSIWTEYAKGRYDEKVKYFYDPVSVPIKDNVNRAFSNSNGEYWIFIGDDDFVSPYILDVVKMMKEKGIEALTYTLKAYYWWGNIKSNNDNRYKSHLAKPNMFLMPNKINNEIILKDSKKELKQTLKKGAISYFDLPRLYNGIVKRDVIYQIKKLTGNYLVGSCPDMSLCISLALVLNEYYFMDYPAGIFGHSGIRYNNKDAHFNRLENLSFLPKNISHEWNPNIPRFWCNSTIWPQTVYETLNAFHSDKKINFIPCYAYVIIRYWREKQVLKETIALLFFYSKFNILKYMNFIYFAGERFAAKVYHSICLLLKKQITYGVSVSKLSTAEDVMIFLKQYPYNK